MTTLEFESQPAVLGSAKASTAPLRRVSRAARARLAVVSTYDNLCGIAAYTRSLERQLGDIFDVTVFDLNQFLLRSTHSRVRKFGDKHIQAICREIRHYDTVNLQLEHGTLGRGCSDIFRRFSWILRSSPQLSVTFHSIMQSEGFDFRECFKEVCRFNFTKAIAMRAHYMRSNRLSAGIASRLRRAQRLKPVSVIVHTRRDLWHMKYVHGIRNAYDHPLSFLGGAEAQEIRSAASLEKFAVLESVPAHSKLIGVFGFLGRYKGFDTVIRALHHLPEEYHLLIFGGVHPNEIRRHQSIDPVVSFSIRRWLHRHECRRADAGISRRDHACRLGRRRRVDARSAYGTSEGPVEPHSFPGCADRCRFPGGHGDLRCGGVSVYGGWAILFRPDIAIPPARLPGDRLAHPHLSAVCPLSPEHGRVF